MIPTIVERTTFTDWPDWETRFTSNGTAWSPPLSSASPPPPDPTPTKYRAATPRQHYGISDAEQKRVQARRKRPNKPISETCPQGAKHRWVLKGTTVKDAIRVRCTKCKRTTTKESVPNLVLVSAAYPLPRPMPLDPESLVACDKAGEHYWQRWGKDHQLRPLIKCKWCKKYVAGK